MDKDSTLRLQLFVRQDLSSESGISPEAESFFRGQCAVQEERRQARRKPVELQALIHLKKGEDHLVFLPAVIRNISITGVMMEIVDKGHMLVGSMDTIDEFAVSFIIPGDSVPVTVNCQPKRIEMSSVVGLGVEFCPEDEKGIQRFLM